MTILFSVRWIRARKKGAKKKAIEKGTEIINIHSEFQSETTPNQNHNKAFHFWSFFAFILNLVFGIHFFGALTFFYNRKYILYMHHFVIFVFIDIFTRTANRGKLTASSLHTQTQTYIS